MNAALWLLIGLAPLAAAATAAGGASPSWVDAALARAVASSVDIPDPFHRAQSLAAVAEAQVVAGESASAVQLLHTAREAAEDLDNDALASWALHDIALAYTKAGDLENARETARDIMDPALRDAVLAAVVDALRSARKFSSARETAALIQDSARQGQSLRRVVLAQAAAGDLDEALATARSIVHARLAAIALRDVAGAFARSRHFAEARALAARIRPDDVRNGALVDIVAAQVIAGDVEGASAAVSGISDRLAKAEAFAHVAAARARRGEDAVAAELFTEAVALAERKRMPAERRCMALVEIAREQVSVGSMAAARETLRSALTLLAGVKRKSDRLPLLGQIASLQARVGDYQAARATAWSTEDQSVRPLLMREIVAIQAEAGDVAGAVAAARSLEDRPAGVAAFIGILGVQAQARDASGMLSTIEAALDVVRIMQSEEQKAGALASLAAAQLVAGDRDSARTTFDEAMRTAERLAPGPARASAYSRIVDALAERDS